MILASCTNAKLCTVMVPTMCPRCHLTVDRRCMSRHCPFVHEVPRPEATRGVNSGHRSWAGNSPTHFWLNAAGFSGKFLAGIFLGVLVFGSPCFAADCPADRPISRRVVDYSQPVTCTLMACLSRLVCPQDGGACSYVAADCNRCTEPVAVDRCFTADEIEKASK